MVPVIFVEELADELGIILSHMQLPDPSGGRTKINVFQFGLPIEKTIEKTKDRTKEISKKTFPYALIIPQEGTVTGEGLEPQKVYIYLLIGIYDDDTDNQGKKHVLNIINDICERFLKDPVLKGGYYADEEIKWVVDTEEEYPYHYGAVWMTFNIPTFRRENRYA